MLLIKLPQDNLIVTKKNICIEIFHWHSYFKRNEFKHIFFKEVYRYIPG